MTAMEYLQKYQPHRLKKSSARNEYELTDHDSFKINSITSKWHWKSRDIGGLSALNFLIHVDGMEFQEAVKLLCEENPSYIPPADHRSERKPFQLPKANPNNRRVIQYLNRRGISDGVIRYCLRHQILYESERYHNAVFVGKDEAGKAKYAFLRGIYDKDGKPFRIEQAGSDKAYAFCIPADGSTQRVTVYEAAIDAMAHMTLERGQADKHRLALGGISAPKEGEQRNLFKKPVALEHFLHTHPEVTEIELCMDNDFAGRYAAGQIAKVYGESYTVIQNLPQKEGMDYGDVAKQARKQIKEQDYGR